MHEINDLDDLGRMRYQPDCRYFAAFHPAFPDAQLIFVEVALTAVIPDTIDTLLSTLLRH